METNSNKEACSIAAQETERKDGAENLLKAGIDGMTGDEVFPYLKEHCEEFLSELRSGRYKPKAVSRVEISKPDGGM